MSESPAQMLHLQQHGTDDFEGGSVAENWSACHSVGTWACWISTSSALSGWMVLGVALRLGKDGLVDVLDL